MAKTYAGYVKREVANEIDWSSIGSGISDMLLAERKAREDKKKEIDDASREFSKVLTEAEGSGHTGINQFFLDGANSIQEVRLMQDRLLRSGELRLKDYNVQRQNAIDGTNEMLALVKGYDTKYKEKMERLQSGVSAAQEQYQMEQIEGFSNFQNHRLYVNPANGQFSIGKTVPGKGGINELSKDPNDFSTMQALRNRLNIKIDKYDWDKNVQQGVDNLAKIVLAKNAGGITTAEDARQSKEYKRAKERWIDSMMTNSVNAGSMLTDWIGGYGFTQNSFQAEGDDSKILLVPDPRQPSSGNLVPKLSDAQEKIVKQRLEQEFESRVDRIETAMPTTETQRAVARVAKTAGQTVTSLATMQAGKTLEERKLSASDIAGRDNSIIKIIETPEEILVTRQTDKAGAQPITTPYQRGDATLGFVKGSASGLTGIEDLNTAIRNSGLTEGMVAATIKDTNVLFERTTPPKPPSGLVRFDAQLTSDFNPNVITDEDFTDDATVLGKLAPIATKYGVTIENPTRVSGDSLIFKIGTGNNEVTQEIDFSDTGREGLLEALKGFIKANKDASERFLALESETTGVDYTNK
jgi:hypothetical protein